VGGDVSEATEAAIAGIAQQAPHTASDMTMVEAELSVELALMPTADFATTALSE